MKSTMTTMSTDYTPSLESYLYTKKELHKTKRINLKGGILQNSCITMRSAISASKICDKVPMKMVPDSYARKKSNNAIADIQRTVV